MNSIKANAPYLVHDHSAYLELNGFEMSVFASNGVLFSSPEFELLFINDEMIVKQWCPGDGQNANGFREIQRFNGISRIDETQFQFLLDAMNVVRLKDFIRKAQKELKFDFFVQLGHSIIPADT